MGDLWRWGLIERNVCCNSQTISHRSLMRQRPMSCRRWEWRNGKQACTPAALLSTAGLVQFNATSAFLPLSLYVSSVASYCQTPPLVPHSYRLVSVVLLFYRFVSFPHRALQWPISLMNTHPQMQMYPLQVTFFPLSVDISPVLFAHYLWLPFLFNPMGRANLILRESRRI